MQGRRTILMVEDEESITVPLSEALAREGFDTEVAGTAAEALELAGRLAPDLVLLDVMLPDGSGYDVCRELRRESQVPIIMLTARGEETDRIVGWSSGPTTTSSSRSAPARWPPASGRSCAVPPPGAPPRCRAARRPCGSATSGSTPPAAAPASTARSSTSPARSSSCSSC